jgi:hypothetical protein
LTHIELSSGLFQETLNTVVCYELQDIHITELCKIRNVIYVIYPLHNRTNFLFYISVTYCTVI